MGSVATLTPGPVVGQRKVEKLIRNKDLGNNPLDFFTRIVPGEVQSLSRMRCEAAVVELIDHRRMRPEAKPS
jgi:hypothetical protein